MTDAEIRRWLETCPAEARERLLALMARYAALLVDPAALIAEVRRIGQRPHVMADPELSLLLGMLVGRVSELQRVLDGLVAGRPDGREH